MGAAQCTERERHEQDEAAWHSHLWGHRGHALSASVSMCDRAQTLLCLISCTAALSSTALSVTSLTPVLPLSCPSSRPNQQACNRSTLTQNPRIAHTYILQPRLPPCCQHQLPTAPLTVHPPLDLSIIFSAGSMLIATFRKSRSRNGTLAARSQAKRRAGKGVSRSFEFQTTAVCWQVEHTLPRKQGRHCWA